MCDGGDRGDGGGDRGEEITYLFILRDFIFIEIDVNTHIHLHVLCHIAPCVTCGDDDDMCINLMCVLVLLVLFVLDINPVLRLLVT